MSVVCCELCDVCCVLCDVCCVLCVVCCLLVLVFGLGGLGCRIRPLQAMAKTQVSKDNKKVDRQPLLTWISTVSSVSDKELIGVLRVLISLRLSDLRGQFRDAVRIVEFLGRTSF